MGSIIDVSKKKRKIRKYVERAFTFLGWAVLLVLALRVLTVLAWGITASFFYKELFVPPLYWVTLKVLFIVLLLGMLIFFASYLWATYNYRKFGKKNRRQQNKSYSLQDLEKLTGIDKDALEKLKRSPLVRVKSLNGKKEFSPEALG